MFFGNAFRTAMLSLVLVVYTAAAFAHVTWTRVNDVDPDCVALYKFDSHDAAVGDTLAVEAPLASDLGLLVGATAGTGASAVHVTPSAIFEPHSLKLESTQDVQSPGTITGLDGDLTIEFWFKWDALATSSTLTIGLSSGAKFVLARDIAVPANDQLGIAFTHGDFASAPGFVDWPTVGTEEASLDEWRHYAVTIHSTGMTYNAGSGHDEYNAGSTATIWLNGHATGAAPHSFPIAGMKAHDASRVLIRNIGGTVYVDEFTIWTKDWSGNGTVSNPFAEGRGDGLPSSVGNWNDYE